MALYNIHDVTIYPYFDRIANFVRENRDANTDADTQHALNLNIILAAACRVEGILESKGKLLLGYHRAVYKLIEMPNFEVRRSMNIFYNRIEADLSNKVARCTGLDSYDSLFDLLIGKSMKEDKNIRPFIEAMSVLFQLRNVIAHGRQIHAYEISSPETNHEIEERFLGGYKKAEAFLMKSRLLDEKFADCESADLFFTNEIADYFYDVSNKFLDALDIFIEENLDISEIMENSVAIYNEKQGTSYSVMEYFQMRGCIA